MTRKKKRLKIVIFCYFRYSETKHTNKPENILLKLYFPWPKGLALLSKLILGTKPLSPCTVYSTVMSLPSGRSTRYPPTTLPSASPTSFAPKYNVFSGSSTSYLYSYCEKKWKGYNGIIYIFRYDRITQKVPIIGQ